MSFVRFSGGIDFCSADDQPVVFMFGIVTPPYEDRLYCGVLKWVGRMFRECDWLRDALLAAQTPAEVRSIFLGLARGNV
jgi:mannitol/fructose-specific phosphotransferase system IIA component (Ntr-type)